MKRVVKLRSNRLSQTHLIEVNGATRLSGKLQQLLQVDISFHIKLVQRLLSLASDLITDIQLHGDDSTAALNQALIQDFTTKEWCDSVSSVLVSQVFLVVFIGFHQYVFNKNNLHSSFGAEKEPVSFIFYL